MYSYCNSILLKYSHSKSNISITISKQNQDYYNKTISYRTRNISDARDANPTHVPRILHESYVTNCLNPIDQTNRQQMCFSENTLYCVLEIKMFKQNQPTLSNKCIISEYAIKPQGPYVTKTGFENYRLYIIFFPSYEIRMNVTAYQLLSFSVFSFFFFYHLREMPPVLGRKYDYVCIDRPANQDDSIQERKSQPNISKSSRSCTFKSSLTLDIAIVSSPIVNFNDNKKINSTKKSLFSNATRPLPCQEIASLSWHSSLQYCVHNCLPSENRFIK